jgi:hypothetical protein
MKTITLTAANLVAKDALPKTWRIWATAALNAVTWNINIKANINS